MTDLAARPIVFLHLPKTAGQTIHNALAAAVGAARVSPIRTHTQVQGDAAQFPLGHALYSGHLDWAGVGVLPARRFVFTVLRDPRERIASFYFYLRREAARLSPHALARPENHGLKAALERSAEDYFFGGDAAWQGFVRDHFDNFYCAYFATGAFAAQRSSAPCPRPGPWRGAARDLLLWTACFGPMPCGSWRRSCAALRLPSASGATLRQCGRGAGRPRCAAPLGRLRRRCRPPPDRGLRRAGRGAARPRDRPGMTGSVMHQIPRFAPQQRQPGDQRQQRDQQDIQRLGIIRMVARIEALPHQPHDMHERVPPQPVAIGLRHGFEREDTPDTRNSGRMRSTRRSARWGSAQRPSSSACPPPAPAARRARGWPRSARRQHGLRLEQQQDAAETRHRPPEAAPPCSAGTGRGWRRQRSPPDRPACCARTAAPAQPGPTPSCRAGRAEAPSHGRSRSCGPAAGSEPGREDHREQGNPRNRFQHRPEVAAGDRPRWWPSRAAPVRRSPAGWPRGGATGGGISAGSSSRLPRGRTSATTPLPQSLKRRSR